MRFWHGLGYTPMEELETLALHAEKLGFFGITLGDHWVTAETQVDRYNQGDGERPWQTSVPWPDPWVTFAALSRATQTLRFMPTVYILPLRDVFTAAKAISTTAIISGGRIHLGLGVGWQKLEFELSGQPFHRRGRHIDEQIEILMKLWTGEMVEHHGDFYDFPPVCMRPALTEEMPIYFGGTSPAAFRRAAHHDGWEGAFYPWEEIEGYVKSAKQARLDAERSLDDFRIIVGCTEPSPERMETLRSWGVTDYLKQPWTEGLVPVTRTLEYKLDEMSRFAETYIQG
jgi:probable F420-dependent oxidoreductase